jgi:hypothetical protein
MMMAIMTRAVVMPIAGERCMTVQNATAWAADGNTIDDKHATFICTKRIQQAWTIDEGVLMGRPTIHTFPDADTFIASMRIFFLTCLLHLKVACFHGICKPVLLCTIIRYGENSVVLGVVLQ